MSDMIFDSSFIATERTEEHRIIQCISVLSVAILFYANCISSVKGILLKRLPVAANRAFANAGAIGGSPGSPNPVGFSSEGTNPTTTSNGVLRILTKL